MGKRRKFLSAARLRRNLDRKLFLYLPPSARTGRRLSRILNNQRNEASPIREKRVELKRAKCSLRRKGINKVRQHREARELLKSPHVRLHKFSTAELEAICTRLINLNCESDSRTFSKHNIAREPVTHESQVLVHRCLFVYPD